MKRIQILPIALAAAIIVASWSCSRFEAFNLEDLDTEMEFRPFIIAPLAYGSFNLQDVLEAIDTTGFVSLTEDSLLYIYYTDTAYSVKASEIVDLPDKVSTETYIEADIVSSALWGALPPGSELPFPRTDILDFEIEPGDQIDSVILKSGGLSITAASEFKHSGTLKISSPNIFKPNGDTVVHEFVISDASGNYSSDTVFSMAGYKLEISEDAGNAFIRVNYTLTLKKESGGVISPGETASLSVSFESMEFSHVYGFVSNREVLDVDQTLALDFFDIAASLKDITLKAPEFNLYVDNSYGIPMEIDLSSIQARSTSEGTTLPLIFDHDSLKVFQVKAPTVEQIGETVNSMHPINGGNSNLEDILSASPNRLDFDITANTGTIPGSGIQNFLLDTSQMDVIFEVVLPMWLQTGGYALQDTIDMDIGEVVGNLNFVDSATITLNYINELPLEVRLQGYFLNSSGTVLDSLFAEGSKTIESSSVDDDGVLIPDPLGLNEKKFEIEMTGEQMSNLSDCVFLWFKADASTAEMGTKFVKFYSYYELSYSLFIDAYFRLNTEELIGSEEQ